MTIAHEVDVPETLKAITRRLDDTQDLLEAAVQHLGTLETRLTRHDYAIHDLHWDAARILTSDNSDAATTPDFLEQKSADYEEQHVHFPLLPAEPILRDMKRLRCSR